MAGVSKCCLTGFKWGGTPTGKEIKLANLDTYVAGSNKDVAILVIHDLFGWKFPNLRLLTDHYAEEVGATAYLPDFFHGEAMTPEVIEEEVKQPKLLPAFIKSNSKQNRRDDIFAFARALRSEHGYKHIGAIGFCYGGWAVFELGAKQHNSGDEKVVDCISTAHPSWLEKSDIDNVAVPVQILAPEHDNAYSPELKEHTLKVFPTLGIPFDYQYFPGVEHAFATRGNQEDKAELKAMQRAKDVAVNWFQTWLHE